MKRLLLIACLALVFLTGASALAQDSPQLQDESEPGWAGVGFRFIPQALSPLYGFYSDPSLNTALTLRYWFNQSFALEVGGWFYAFEDAWTRNSNTLLMGGLLFNLAVFDDHTFYLAGRGINFVTQSQGTGYYCDGLVPPEEDGSGDKPQPTPIVPPPCWPSGSSSRSTTLAVSATLGSEWMPLSNIGLDFEFGLIYAQTVTTTDSTGGRPIPLPTEPPAMPEQVMETFASAVLSPTLSFQVIFYIF